MNYFFTDKEKTREEERQIVPCPFLSKCHKTEYPRPAADPSSATDGVGQITKGSGWEELDGTIMH